MPIGIIDVPFRSEPSRLHPAGRRAGERARDLEDDLREAIGRRGPTIGCPDLVTRFLCR
ncbi:MAG TPA: hypothetical protein VIR33_16835 [Thermopolyspora sp.]